MDKYRFSAGAWSRLGAIDVAGVTGLVANLSAGNVSLALTTPTQLLTVSDAGAANTTFAPAAPTVLATASADTEFRGVALAPTGTTGPSLYLRTPVRNSSTDISTSSVSVSALVDSAVAVTGVKVTIGSATVAATKGAGKVWTATVPAGSLSAGATNVVVAATDPTGTTTVTRPIVLSGSSVPSDALSAGTYSPSTAKVKRTGTWKAYLTSVSPTGKGLTSSTKNTALTTKVYGKGLVLAFTKGPSAGKVKITVDGASVTLDLYAAKGGNLAKSYTFTGAIASHTVKITALGTKSAKSKNTAVPIAALKVTA